MTIDISQFHQVFFEESFEGLEVMESGLLNMDPGEVDAEEINAIFRAAHSIKGGSATFGFNDIAAFTHIMETLLDEMRDGRRQVTDKALEVLLRSVDVLREMLTASNGSGGLDEGLVKGQLQELEAVLNDRSDEPASGSDSDAGAVSTAREVIGWHLVFRPLPRMMQTGNDPLRILRELASLGDMEVEGDISLLPVFAQFDPEECYLSWNIHLKAGVDRLQIDEVFDWVEDECDLAVIPLYADARELIAAGEPAKDIIADLPSTMTVAEEPNRPDRRKNSDRRKADRRVEQRRASAAPASSSIRVDITKIDALINMVGELVITQSMLSMLSGNFHMGQVDRLRDGLAQLERHTREMQESVMQIRMLPISFTFSRFPRLVHDLSTQMGKKIELRMSGENTEVDKTVIEKIGDPLVHLVRNSLDHGIEMPDQRVAAGKPETGVVELNAFHNGGSIVIEIRDDGKGLDSDRIRRKAIEKGLIEESAKMSDQQLHELIFQPGFSTADKVNDLSGRGVGMDVVRRNINELGGNIEIESESGRGSAIIIRLPLTLAILDGQIISVGDEIYIVPLISIIESLQVRPDGINLVAGRGEVFKLRDEYLPVVRLHEVFGIEGNRAQDLKDGLLVVVEGDGRRCGILVDDLIGQQQVVIKSLEANYGRVEGVSGATILGDGSVALILDIPGIMRLTNQLPELQLVKRTA